MHRCRSQGQNIQDTNGKDFAIVGDTFIKSYYTISSESSCTYCVVAVRLIIRSSVTTTSLSPPPMTRPKAGQVGHVVVPGRRPCDGEAIKARSRSETGRRKKLVKRAVRKKILYCMMQRYSCDSELSLFTTLLATILHFGHFAAHIKLLLRGIGIRCSRVKERTCAESPQGRQVRCEDHACLLQYVLHASDIYMGEPPRPVVAVGN